MSHGHKKNGSVPSVGNASPLDDEPSPTNIEASGGGSGTTKSGGRGRKNGSSGGVGRSLSRSVGRSINRGKRSSRKLARSVSRDKTRGSGRTGSKSGKTTASSSKSGSKEKKRKSSRKLGDGDDEIDPTKAADRKTAAAGRVGRSFRDFLFCVIRQLPEIKAP